MSDLRATILEQTEKIASKSRFGLFSQPPPVSIGDDGAYKQKQHSRGQDGKPITKPRNLLGGTNRSGVGKKGFINIPDSIYIGDKYEDKFKLDIKYDQRMHTKSQMHETQFKPASGYKSVIKASYEYEQQKPLTEKKRKLDQNGRVLTQPRNVSTNIMSKVEREFMKNPEYIPDPYDRKKIQEIKERQIWESKLPEASWKFTKSCNGIFNRSKFVYGEDDNAKNLINKKKAPKKLALKTVAHEAQFVLAVKSVHETISKYPKAMSAQTFQPLRPKTTGEKKDQQRWRPSSIPKSKPTPSITLNKKNISIARYK